MASKIRAPEMSTTRGAHHEFASLAEALQNASAYDVPDAQSAEDDDSPKKSKAAIAKKWKVRGTLMGLLQWGFVSLNELCLISSG